MKITSNFFKITTYHFKGESENRGNGRKNDLYPKQENNDYGVDAIMIIKYYKK